MPATWTTDEAALQAAKDTYAHLLTRPASSYSIGGSREIHDKELKDLQRQIEWLEGRVAEAANPSGVAVADFQRPV